MKKTRFKRVHSHDKYMDADFVSAEWTKSDELLITIELESSSNRTSPQTAKVYFMGVQNRSEIEACLTDLKKRGVSRINTIEGFFTSGRGNYHLGPCDIWCKSILEL